MELPGKQLTLLQDAVKYGKCSYGITRKTTDIVTRRC